MKMRATCSFSRSRAGFSLIEMIGVMAVMAILATVLVPNALKSIERSAVRTEAETLRNLGEQAKLYLRDAATMPTAANWNTVLGTYASLSPAELLTNRRQMNRVYVLDPVAANQRALLISSMRTGVAPQTAAFIGANGTRFSDVWNWNTSGSPFAAPGGWGAWNAANIEYLVIERINFAPVYRTDLQAYTVSLRNLGTGTTSYRLIRANGSTVVGNISAGTSVALTSLYARDRVELYKAASQFTLDLTYVVSTTGKTYDFNGTNWLPQ